MKSIGQLLFCLHHRCNILNQIVQIRDFLKSDFGKFLLVSQNKLKSGLKKSRICPILIQSGPLWRQTGHPCQWCLSRRHYRESDFWTVFQFFQLKFEIYVWGCIIQIRFFPSNCLFNMSICEIYILWLRAVSIKKNNKWNNTRIDQNPF